MEIKGSVTVKSIVNVGRRVNEGLNRAGIQNGSYTLTTFSSKIQNFTATVDSIVLLPQESSILPGWSVMICNAPESVGKISVKTQSGTDPLTTIFPGKIFTIVFVSTDGVSSIWRVFENGSSNAANKSNTVIYAENGVLELNNLTVTTLPCIVQVSDGIDSIGNVAQYVIPYAGGETITHTSTTNDYEHTYIYIDANGDILQEKYKQIGGSVFPAAPKLGQIFFHKALMRNYKYGISGWEEYPCVAAGEILWDGNSEPKNVITYQKNVWWWDQKYGDVRNTVVISSGTVFTTPDMTGAQAGDVITGVQLGNFIATVACGYDSDGVASDNYVTLGTQVDVPYTFGTPTYYYVTDTGSIYSTTEQQAASEKLPEVFDPISFPSGYLLYSIEDGCNFISDGTDFVKFPLVLVGVIDANGNPFLYPFNTQAWISGKSRNTQFFLDADNQTTTITLSYPIRDNTLLTVNVCNTVLQSNTYTVGIDRRTITFLEPIEAGIQIEVTWVSNAIASFVVPMYYSFVSINDFDNYYSNTPIGIVHTVAGETLHAPVDVTGDWVVQLITIGNKKLMQATCLNNASTICQRVYSNGSWSSWFAVIGTILQ